MVFYFCFQRLFRFLFSTAISISVFNGYFDAYKVAWKAQYGHSVAQAMFTGTGAVDDPTKCKPPSPPIPAYHVMSILLGALPYEIAVGDAVYRQKLRSLITLYRTN